MRRNQAATHGKNYGRARRKQSVHRHFRDVGGAWGWVGSMRSCRYCWQNKLGRIRSIPVCRKEVLGIVGREGIPAGKTEQPQVPDDDDSWRTDFPFPARHVEGKGRRTRPDSEICRRLQTASCCADGEYSASIKHTPLLPFWRKNSRPRWAASQLETSSPSRAGAAGNDQALWRFLRFGPSAA